VKKNNKGFTLMEMLIVVAIIAILVAIAIPVISTSIEKAKKATDEMNINTAFAEAARNMLSTGETGTSKTGPLQSDGETIVLQDGQTYVTEAGVILSISVDTEGNITLESSGK